MAKDSMKLATDKLTINLIIGAYQSRQRGTMTDQEMMQYCLEVTSQNQRIITTS